MTKMRRIKTKLRCDCCGKPFQTLGGYTDDPIIWWVCLECFEKADALAAKEDRWPANRDFEAIAKRRQHHDSL